MPTAPMLVLFTVITAVALAVRDFATDPNETATAARGALWGYRVLTAVAAAAALDSYENDATLWLLTVAGILILEWMLLGVVRARAFPDRRRALIGIDVRIPGRRRRVESSAQLASIYDDESPRSTDLDDQARATYAAAERIRTGHHDYKGDQP